MKSTMGLMADGEKIEGYVMQAGCQIRWLRGVSKACAWSMAKKRGAAWCRPFVLRNGVKVVCC